MKVNSYPSAKIWIICRVCLKQQDEMYNLFDNTYENIWCILRDCGGVPVRKNDDLPDQICEDCLKRLWKALNFRNDCQRGHRELVQKVMERNGEEAICSDYLSISNLNSPNHNAAKEEVQITNPADNNEVILDTNSENKYIEKKSNNNDIKQYYVVTKNEKDDTNRVQSENFGVKNPIVLLIKLKDIPENESHTEKNKKDLTIKTAQKLKANNRFVSKKPNKIEIVKKKGSQLENKTSKTKAKRILKTKLKTNVINQKKLVCKVCKKIYKTSELLHHHMNIHKRPYQCKICNKRFSQKQNFVNHNNWHTGIKPYNCRTCCQTFTDVSNRNTHERTRHKKQEFKCEKCNKTFRFSNLLQKHSQTHRPKKCFICNKEFASLQMVREHHRRKHLKLV